MPKELGDWAGTAEFVLGANFAGKDLKEVSAIDKVRAQDRNSAIACRQGLGTLVAKLGEPLAAVVVDAGEPHRMGQPRRHRADARRQDHRARRHRHRVDQCADRGQHQVRARYPEALFRRGVETEPRQLRSHRPATAGQSAGPRARRHRHRAEQFDPHRRCCPPTSGSSSLCSIDVGGSFGRDLSAQGEAAMVAFAVEWLTKMFGSDVAAAVKKSSVTRWNAAPHVLGAMSSAGAGRAAVAQDSDRADRLHVSRGRSHPRNPVGHGRWRLGKRRARGRSGTAQDRRAARYPSRPKPHRRGAGKRRERPRAGGRFN